MKPTKSLLFIAGTLTLFAVFAALVLMSAQTVSAIAPAEAAQQDLKDCLRCHEQPATLWESSPHREHNVSCTVCHKLADSVGTHPETSKYTVESEETTCLACHGSASKENVASEMAASQHAAVGLNCVSCHEQHSQGLKVASEARTVCENCHKAEMRNMVESTHFAAGLSCVNCHMGDGKDHSMNISASTCSDCHTDLHQAREMLDAGVEVNAMANPKALVTQVPAEQTPPTAPQGGVHLPAWVYALAGVIIGGVAAWAAFGREPGSANRKNPN
ncbi:MAG: hypothetical protein HKUEN02_14350 [Anaerolineaceae bacterium]|nr:MAG: hypothetical protein HKUEN02_14350 [Anaerolineaceae bacterium]